MAGTGHMNAVNKVLQKNTQNLIDKRKNYKKNIRLGNSNSELSFKKISKEELEKLKEKIRIEAKKSNQQSTIALLIITFIVLSVFYYLFSDFNIDFKIFFRQS